MACLPPPEHARLRLEVNFYSEAFMLSSTFWTFLHGHFATKLRFQSYILLVKMPDDDAWGRYKTILETLKFETVWFILVLFYVMVVFSVVVPIASRFNYQVDMLLLLINHPCAGAPPLLRVSLNSLSAWSGQLSWRDTAVTYLQTLRLENTVLQRTTNKHFEKNILTILTLLTCRQYRNQQRMC